MCVNKDHLRQMLPSLLSVNYQDNQSECPAVNSFLPIVTDALVEIVQSVSPQCPFLCVAETK